MSDTCPVVRYAATFKNLARIAANGCRLTLRRVATLGDAAPGSFVYDAQAGVFTFGAADADAEILVKRDAVVQ